MTTYQKWRQRVSKLPKGLSLTQAAKRMKVPYQSARTWLWRCDYKPVDGRLKTSKKGKHASR